MTTGISVIDIYQTESLSFRQIYDHGSTCLHLLVNIRTGILPVRKHCC